MTPLYTAQYLHLQRSAYHRWRRISLAITVVTLAVCVALCFFVTTRNATVIFSAATGLSIAAGWTYLLVIGPKKRIRKAEFVHCDKLLRKVETQYDSGRIFVSSQVVQIPGSIAVRSVRLENDGSTRQYHLNANFTLPGDGSVVTLASKDRYIVAYEVLQDE